MNLDLKSAKATKLFTINELIHDHPVSSSIYLR